MLGREAEVEMDYGVEESYTGAGQGIGHLPKLVGGVALE